LSNVITHGKYKIENITSDKNEEILLYSNSEKEGEIKAVLVNLENDYYRLTYPFREDGEIWFRWYNGKYNLKGELFPYNSKLEEELNKKK